MVLVGKPFLEIIHAVLREGYDLVKMAAQGEDKPNARLFGKTSPHLMQKCPCPIWVMKPTTSRHFSRVLVAVDA